MQIIDSVKLRESLRRASEHLERNAEVLNNLNVFPIPDGDTGSNMAYSMKMAMKRLDSAGDISFTETAELIRRELNRHSRGNSGFILARFFHGFFSVEESCLSRASMSERFANGLYCVNNSLFAPSEGTMLTVIRAMSDYIRESEIPDIPGLFAEALGNARLVLMKTPEMLPVLSRAGVIDSGALGFIVLFEGFLAAIRDTAIPLENENDYRFPPDLSISEEALSPRFYRYCTELLIRAEQPFDEKGVRNFLQEIGNSIALVVDSDYIKVHIHTDEPETVRDRLGRYGALENEKIEDMQSQMQGLQTGEAGEESCEVFACLPGSGFDIIFRDLGVRETLIFREHLPSAIELKNALDTMPGKSIILLTNNKNIIPVAGLARNDSDKNVTVFPTESVVQGIAAMYGYSENDSISENIVNMRDCMEFVSELRIFRSVMDTSFGELLIKTDDFFSVRDGEILQVSGDLDSVLIGSMQQIDLESVGNVTFYRTSQVAEAELNGVLAYIAERNDAIEVEIFVGDQTRELLIISIE